MRLTPATPADVDRITALLHQPEVRRYLCDDGLLPRSDVARSVARSGDPSDVARMWSIETARHGFVGMIALQQPGEAVMRQRNIGWRSLELTIALAPAHWGAGLASAAVALAAGEARADPVTFALLAAVDEPNERSHQLMARCGFAELGRVSGLRFPLVVYELAL